MALLVVIRKLREVSGVTPHLLKAGVDYLPTGTLASPRAALMCNPSAPAGVWYEFCVAGAAESSSIEG